MNDTPVLHHEPTPITDKENPFESMMKRFDIAAEILNLEPGLYNYLKTPAKQMKANENKYIQNPKN